MVKTKAFSFSLGLALCLFSTKTLTTYETPFGVVADLNVQKKELCAPCPTLPLAILASRFVTSKTESACLVTKSTIKTSSLVIATPMSDNPCSLMGGCVVGTHKR